MTEAELKYKIALHEWADGSDAGTSSRTIARICGEINLTGHNLAPLDQWDFGRCVRLVRAFPALRDGFDKLRGVSSEWAWYVDKWDRLEDLYDFDQEMLCKEIRAHQQQCASGLITIEP